MKHSILQNVLINDVWYSKTDLIHKHNWKWDSKHEEKQENRCLGNCISLRKNLLHSHFLRGRIWWVNLSILFPKRFCHLNTPHLNQCLSLISTVVQPTNFHRAQVHVPFVLKLDLLRIPSWGLNGMSCESRCLWICVCCTDTEHCIPSDRGFCVFFDKCICVSLWYARPSKEQGTEEWPLLPELQGTINISNTSSDLSDEE